jgi:hypothetical protein
MVTLRVQGDLGCRSGRVASMRAGSWAGTTESAGNRPGPTLSCLGMGWLASVALQGRSPHPRAWRAAIFAAAASAMACSSRAPPPQPLVITLLVEGDPGVPVAHAQVLYAGKEVATTGADGTAKLTLGGDEGQSFDLSVQCPEGYKSPPAPVAVTLKRASSFP